MEAISAVTNNNTMVPEVLGDMMSYDTWSSFMEDYLTGQDLWDVVTEPKPDDEETSMEMMKRWRIKNALALHAIKMSCGPNLLPVVVGLKSAKEAWDFLASTSSYDGYEDGDDDNIVEESSKVVYVETLVEEQSNIVNDDTERLTDVHPDEPDYDLFITAVQEENVPRVETFMEDHPDALTARVFPGGSTALHHALDSGKEKIAMWLIDTMSPSDLETLDGHYYTPLARCADKDYPGVLHLLQLLYHKNCALPNIGEHNIPVIIASQRGFKNSARFLYSVTDKNILSPECGDIGLHLLLLCIQMKAFDVALNLGERFPDMILQESPAGDAQLKALAVTFSDLSDHESDEQLPRFMKMFKGSNENQNDDQARVFFELVCSKVSSFKEPESIMRVYPAMIYSAKQGNVEFVKKMLRANPLLVCSHADKKSMFWYAVENRQEKIFNFIYGAPSDLKDPLLYDREGENSILDLVAMLPPPSVLDRISSSPALLMQREVLWFKEVWKVAHPYYRESRNKDGLTPRQLFSKTHKGLIADGEKLMKETATSSTVVGALILTIMFAAAFTVPGGSNQDTGHPLFGNKPLFKLYIICDVLSLSSSTTSILVFLTILSNSYVEEDFLFDLPRRLMIGVMTLFLAIATMMITFCLALALILDEGLYFILSIAVITSVPVLLFSSSMFPLISKIFYSTFGSNIFDRSTKLPTAGKKEAVENTMNYGMV